MYMVVQLLVGVVGVIVVGGCECVGRANKGIKNYFGKRMPLILFSSLVLSFPSRSKRSGSD